MHVEPYAKKKIQVLDSAVVCHIDESALFESQVNYSFPFLPVTIIYIVGIFYHYTNET